MSSNVSAGNERELRKGRLGLRLDAEAKAMIERAAELEHREVTDFCVSALTEAARQTIARHETLTLSERDRAAFFEALVNPPEPDERLVRAFSLHARRLGSE